MPRWRYYLFIILLLGIAAEAVSLGLQVRRHAWTYSEGVHVRGDIGSAYQWGLYADQYGLFHLYDKDETLNPPRQFVRPGIPFSLRGHKTDYTPLRLAIAYEYFRWAHRHFPDTRVWQDDYDFSMPMLWGNTWAELSSAILVFLIIRLWRVRADPPTQKRSLRGCVVGLFGAMLVWFNPAVIWDAHAWPQWDIWPVPCYLAAVLLASLDWWLMAGICLAIGALLKGQLLLAAPVMLLWPLFRGHLNHALRLVSGFVIAMALVTLPWMHPSPAGVHWLVMMGVAILLVSPLFIKFWRRDWRLIAAPIAVAVLLAWPWQGDSETLEYRLLALLIVGVAACLRFLPRRFWWPSLLCLAGGAIFLVMPVFSASSSWYRLGFKYGTEKFDAMVTGNGAYNVPRLLWFYERWPNGNAELVTLPVTLPMLGKTVTYSVLTRIVYGTCLALCGLGAALHDRRRDARILVSLVAPWMLFFLILTEMHGRYTMWAAALSGLMAGTDIGLALLGVIWSLVGWMGIAQNQLLFAPRWSQSTLRQLQALDPAVGLILLLIGIIYLYVAVMPQILQSRRTIPKATLKRFDEQPPVEGQASA